MVDTIHLVDSLPAMIESLSSDPTGHEIIATTGSTGSSDADHLRPALSDLGATLLIDGIRVRPGSPSLFARLADGRFVVGLPGNPFAAILALQTIGDPLPARMTGAPAPLTHRVTVGVAVEDERPLHCLFLSLGGWPGVADRLHRVSDDARLGQLGWRPRLPAGGHRRRFRGRRVFAAVVASSATGCSAVMARHQIPAMIPKWIPKLRLN